MLHSASDQNSVTSGSVTLHKLRYEMVHNTCEMSQRMLYIP